MSETNIPITPATNRLSTAVERQKARLNSAVSLPNNQVAYPVRNEPTYTGTPYQAPNPQDTPETQLDIWNREQEKHAFRDSELDTPLGVIGNTLTAAGAGAIRIGTDIAAGFVGDDEILGLTDPRARELYERERYNQKLTSRVSTELENVVNKVGSGELSKSQGELRQAQLHAQLNSVKRFTPEEIGILNSKVNPDNPNSNTQLELLNLWQEKRDKAQSIRDYGKELSSFHNPSSSNKLVDDISKSTSDDAEQIKQGLGQISDGEYLSGAGNVAGGAIESIVDTVSAAVDNPDGLVNLIADEGLPILAAAINKRLGLATNTISSVGAASTAKDVGIEQFREENDRLPTPEELAGINRSALLYAGADFLGTSKASSSVTDAVEQLTKRKAVTKAVKNVGSATAAESTAGFIQGLEEETGLKGNTDYSKVDPGKVLTSTLVEGLVGGSTVGALSIPGVQPAIKGTATAAYKGTKYAVTNNPVNTARAALDAAKLVGKSVTSRIPTPTLRTRAERQAQAEQAQNVVPDTLLDTGSEDFDLTTSISALHARNQVETVGESEKVTNYQNAKSILNDTRDKIQELGTTIKSGELSQEEVKETKKQLDKMVKDLLNNSNIVTAMGLDIAPDKNEVDELVDTVTKSEEVTPNYTNSLQRIITTTQLSPDTIPVAAIEKVIDSPLLDDSEKQQLRNFVNTQNSIEDLKEQISIGTVREEVLYGNSKKGTNFKGINEYRSEIINAVNTGNLQKARTLRTNLESRTVNHNTKSNNFTTALQEASTTGTSVKVGNNTIHPTSTGLVEAVAYEAAAYNSLLTEVDGLINNPTPPTPSNRTVPEPAVEDSPAENISTVEDTASDNVGNVTPNTQEESVDTPEVVEQVESTNVPEDSETTGETTTEPTEDIVLDSSENIEPEVIEDTTTSVPTNTREQLTNDIATQQAEIDKLRLDLRQVPKLAKESKRKREDVRSELQSQLDTKVEAIKESNKQLRKLDGLDSNYNSAALLTNRSEQDKLLDEQGLSPLELFEQTNQVTKYFTPTKGKTIIKEVSDLTSKLVDNPSLVLRYTEGSTLTSQHETIISSYVDLYNHVSNSVDKLFKPQENRFKNDSYIQYLADDNGQLPESAKTAIAVTIYDSIITTLPKTLYSTGEGINSALGKDSDARVRPEAWDLLGGRGVTRSSLVESLGSGSYKLLGIQPRDNNVPGNIKNQLEQSLGSFTVGVMEDLGMFTYSEVSNADMAKARGVKADPKYARNKTIFLRATSQEGEKGDVLHSSMKSIQDANEESGSFFSNIFNTNSVSTPSIKPDTRRVPKKMKATIQDVPDKALEYLKEHSKEANSISLDTHNVLMNLPENSINDIIGINSDVEGTKHKLNVRSTEAKNKTKLRELANYREWVSTLENQHGSLSTPFYFSHNMWKQMRVGMSETLVNTQRSKIHRGLIRMNEWVKSVDLSSSNQVEAVRMAIAASMGIDVDKQTDQASEIELQELLNTPEVSEGISALHFLMGDNEFSEEDRVELGNSVARAVAKGKGEVMSLRGLVNYVNMTNAIKNGDDTFITDISREMDGVANGPTIGSMQFLASNTLEGLKGVLARGGIFMDGETSYGEFISKPGNLDIYEDLGTEWNKEVQALLEHLQETGNTKPEQDLRIIGKYFQANRGNSKSSLMQTFYNQGAKALTEAMAEEFIATMIEHIEDTVNTDNGKTSSEDIQKLEEWKVRKLESIANNLNILAGQQVINFSGHSSDALKTKFDYKGLNVIRKKVSDLYAAPVIRALDNKYSGFKVNTKEYNEVITAINTIFQTLFNERVKERTQELTDEGVIVEGRHTLPQSELDSILEGLREVMPSIGTELSAGNITSELSFLKTEKEFTDERPYSVRTVFNEKIDHTDINGKVVSSTASIKANGKKEVYTDTGVGSSVLSTQHLDANTAINALGNHSVLNTHDAASSAAVDAKKIGQDINKVFFESMRNTHLPSEAHKSLVRAFNFLKEINVKTDTDLGEEIRVNLIANIPDAVYDKSSYERILGNLIKDYGKRAKEMKGVLDDVLDHVTYSTQYNIEGAGHTVENTKQYVPETSDIQLHDDVEGTNDNYGLGHNPSISNRAKEVGEFDTVEGLLGSMDVPDKALAALFKGLTNKGVELPSIRYLSKNSTDINQEIKNILDNGHAAYSPNDHVIYLKTNDFKAHGMTTETVAHELLHSWLSKLIQTPSDQRTTEQNEAIQDLENLRIKAKALADNATEGNVQKDHPAFTNVDELIAWSMTNKDVQEFLKTVRIQKTPKGKIITGFKDMVQNIQKAIFGRTLLGTSAKTESALNSVIENTGVLLSSTTTPGYKPSPQSINYENATQAINELTSSQLLDALGLQDTTHPRTKEHQEYLKGVQTKIIEQIGGPLGSDLRAREQSLGDATDQYLTSLRDGTVPFTSALRTEFDLSVQESYVAEQLEATFSNLLNEQNDITREMTRLWNLANDNVDSLNLTDSQKEFLFTLDSKSTTKYENTAGKDITVNQADHIQRFVALAIVHKPFKDSLSKLDAKVSSKKLDNLPIGKFLENILESVINLLDRVINPSKRVGGADVDSRINNLLTHLAQIEYRKRGMVKKEINPDSFTAKLVPLVEGIRKSIADVSNVPIIKNSKSNTVRFAGSLVNTIASDRTEKLVDGLMQFRDYMYKGKLGTGAAIVNDAIGSSVSTQGIYDSFRLSNLNIDQQRTQVKDLTKAKVEGDFKTELTREQSNAATKVVLATDIPSLIDSYDITQIETLLSNDRYLNSEVKKLQDQLIEEFPEVGLYYVNQADALGKRITLGATPNSNVSQNAHNIAFLGGAVDRSKRTVSDATAIKAVPIIDRLATLNGLQYTAKSDRTMISELIRSETDNEKGNGVESLIHQMRTLKEESLSQLFDEQHTQYKKGYYPDITNHYLTSEVAGKERGKELIKQGYVRATEAIPRSPLDPNIGEEVHLYTIHDGGQVSLVSGAVSFTGKNAEGTSLADSRAQTQGETVFTNSKADIRAVRKQAEQDMEKLFTERVEAKDSKENHLLPTLNQYGEVQDYRYVMKDKTKDTALQRNNNVGDVVGTLASSIVDKVNSQKSNETTISALHEMYKEDYRKRPHSYLRISVDSDDPRLKDIWNMLPKVTKDYVKDVWGKPELYVRNDVLDLTFGFRKWNVTDAWKVPEEERTVFQRGRIQALELVFGKNIATNLGRGQQGLEEIVKNIKDILVVKNIFTLAGNVLSNFALLWWRGVSVKDIAASHKKGYEDLTLYQKGTKELFNLQNELKVGLVSNQREKSIQNRIKVIEHELANNSVRDLMQAGVFQTIIEDVDQHDDPFAYKTVLEDKFGPITSRVNSKVKAGVKLLTLAHDTAPYKFLNQATQKSDFIARYTEYQYLINRSIEPKSKEDALRQIIADFVNYDVPHPKFLQALNDLGLYMFTKYHIRMIKPIMSMFRDNPVRGISMLLANGFFNISSPLDANPMGALTNVHNPVTTAVGAVDEIAPVNGLLHLTGIKN